MNDHRSTIFEWSEQGRLRPEALPQVLRQTGITPAAADWRRLFDRLTLWIGAVFLAAAVIFFFAYNWQEMGRYAKFGLAESMIVAALAAAWKLGLDRAAGKAALLAATLLTGALLALVGQTYQTGADTYELFTVWALAAAPWVAIGRFAALWLVWIGLLNMAAWLYFRTFGGLLGVLFSVEEVWWVLFALDTLALCLWQAAAWRGIAWLQARWPLRVLATAAGTMLTFLAIWTMFESRNSDVGTFLAYVAWMGAIYYVYRHRITDVFMLAGGVLSGIAVIACFLGKHLLKHNDGAGFLIIGIMVIGLSAAAGFWLKNVAKEEHA